MTGPVTQSVAALEAAGMRYGRRGELVALDGVDLAVRPGEIVGITGTSGCGKSTLLRALAGIERPTTGTLRYAGEQAWRGRARRPAYPRPGYVMAVFQDPFASLDARWPIWRTITEPVAARGGADTELRMQARGLLDSAGMTAVPLDTRPRQLSGGQRQRVAILRAVAARPALIVADEPTAQQDLITAAGLTELLRRAAAHGTALVVVSHDQPWLESLAHRIIPMKAGRLGASIDLCAPADGTSGG